MPTRERATREAGRRIYPLMPMLPTSCGESGVRSVIRTDRHRTHPGNQRAKASLADGLAPPLGAFAGSRNGGTPWRGLRPSQSRARRDCWSQSRSLASLELHEVLPVVDLSHAESAREGRPAASPPVIRTSTCLHLLGPPRALCGGAAAFGGSGFGRNGMSGGDR